MNRFNQAFAKHRAVLWVAAITLLALLLRLINLGFSDLTFDETASYFVASKPLGEMLPYLLRAFHEHPPSYFVTLAGWMQLIGTSEDALRLLSVFCGVLSVPLMYQFGRKAINARAGMVAAVLLALAPAHIFYSQTARMYTLLGALALLTWWLILKLETNNQKRYWLSLTVCSLIGLGTHITWGGDRHTVIGCWQENVSAVYCFNGCCGCPLLYCWRCFTSSPHPGRGTLRCSVMVWASRWRRSSARSGRNVIWAAWQYPGNNRLGIACSSSHLALGWPSAIGPACGAKLACCCCVR
jgi:hypothetical protein